MKTTKIYNSSAAVPSDLQSGGAEGAHLQCAVDCKSTNSMPADYKSTGTFGATIRKAATVLYTLCSVLLISSCTQDELTPEYNDAPLTISANIPGDVWAVATRTGLDNSYTDGSGITVTMISYSDWTLHYTDYNGAAATGALTAAKQTDGSYTLTSGSDLVWARIQDTKDADETFYLTCKASNDMTYYATTTAAHGAAAVAFPDMKPTLAKLTVNFTLTHNIAQVSYSDFTISVTANAAKTATADEVVYNPMTDKGAWPAVDGDAAATAFTLSGNATTENTYTVTGSMLLPQQEMGNTLTVKYGSTTWTLDLSEVAVSGGETDQKANKLIAGQHLTLNLSASILSVGTPEGIQIKAFTAADANSYENDLDGTANKSNE